MVLHSGQTWEWIEQLFSCRSRRHQQLREKDDQSPGPDEAESVEYEKVSEEHQILSPSPRPSSSVYSSISIITLPDPVVIAPPKMHEAGSSPYFPLRAQEISIPKRTVKSSQLAKHCTPEAVEGSVASEDGHSDFSRLASRRIYSRSCSRSTRPLGQLSLAKLTSGVSDGAWSSR